MICIYKYNNDIFIYIYREREKDCYIMIEIMNK